MSHVEHAEREFQALGYDLEDKEDGPNKWIMENIFELLEVFSRQGHSGSSAPYCVSIFEKLARFKPLCPLTGEDSEWTDVGPFYQNKRCPNVFKGKDGRAYNIDGKIFRYPNGSCFTNKDSRVYIQFPYTPKSEFIDVPDESEPEQQEHP